MSLSGPSTRGRAGRDPVGRRLWHDGPVIRRVDSRALLTEPTKDEVARFRASVQHTPAYASEGALWLRSCLVVVAVVVALGVGGVVIGTFVSVGFGTSSPVGPVMAWGSIAFGILFAAALVWGAVAAVRAGARAWPRWQRLDAFARANGLVFSPHDAAPTYPGAIFGLGTDRTATDHLRAAEGRFLDYGNYRYTVKGGKSSTTYRWGFLALHLDRALPHMLLDATSNNGLFGATNLPATFDRSQVLSLEGDFDRHFTLYCPREYERDALTVFTPDVMALLIDEAAPFDVEIVDQWMFVYAATPFDMLDPAVHARLLRIVDTVGAKTLRQTDRYVDERVGAFAPNLVAPEGRRLRRRLPLAVVITVSAIVGIVLLQWIAQAIGGLVAIVGG